MNILSARVSPPQAPAPSRSNSYGNVLSTTTVTESRRSSREDINEKAEEATIDAPDPENEEDITFHEDTPLLSKEGSEYSSLNSLAWHNIPRTISIAFLDSVRWVLSTLAAPGVYLIACLYDERGTFAPFAQIRKLGTVFSGGARRASTTQALGITAMDEGSSLAGQSNGRSAYVDYVERCKIALWPNERIAQDSCYIADLRPTAPTRQILN